MFRGGDAWRVRGFRPLALSYAINDIGDTAGLVALAVLVLDRTDSALATTALFLASKFLPAFVAPALTAALDRFPVGRMLALLYIVEGLAFAELAYLVHTFWLPAVLVVGFVDGLAGITARGLCRSAVYAVLTPSDALREGNSILNGIFAVTGVIGPLLGGVIVAKIGIDIALLVNAGSFAAIAAILAASAHVLPRPEGGPSEHWTRRVRDGLAYVRDHPTVGRLIGGQAVAIAFFTIVIPIQVVYVRESLHASSFAYGLLLATWSVGIAGGAVIFARAKDAPLTTLILASTGAIALGYLGMGLAPTLVFSCLASVIGGLGNGIQWISVVTALQESVDAEYQARAAGLMESAIAATPGIGFALGGLLTATVSPRLAYVVAAAGGVVVVAVWARRPILARTPAVARQTA